MQIEIQHIENALLFLKNHSKQNISNLKFHKSKNYIKRKQFKKFHTPIKNKNLISLKIEKNLKWNLVEIRRINSELDRTTSNSSGVWEAQCRTMPKK